MCLECKERKQMNRMEMFILGKSTDKKLVFLLENVGKSFFEKNISFN